MTSPVKKRIIYCTVFFLIVGLLFLFLQKKLFNASVIKVANMAVLHNPIQPFEMTITNSNYSIAYILSQNEIKIVFQGELEGEKDTVIFRKHLRPSQSLLKLTAIRLDSLKSYYVNPCVRDGSQIIVIMKPS